jgi:hypothetical protein
MKKLMVITLACAALAYAADETRVQKVVPIKIGDANQVFQTVRDVMAGQINVKLYENSVVLNGTAEAVAAAEQLIKNLESSAPRERDVDVTGYIILASTQAGEGSGAVPADLEPVLKQFRSLLNYKSFRVLDTIILRAKENSQAHSGGFLALPNVPAPGATVGFRVGRATITDDVVHLKDLNLGVEVPTTTNKGEVVNRGISLGTDADVRVGQKVAIGKASVDTAGDALILVVSANVVN